MDGLLFSLIVLDYSAPHLVSLTLDTLKTQTEKKFEVVLVGLGGKELTSQYPEVSFQLQTASSPNLASQMNEGLHLARGKYVQFLLSGDRFLSQQGLSYLQELIQEGKEPEFVYSSFLSHDPDEASEAMTHPLNLTLLQKGEFPTTLPGSWFLKDAVLGLGGFDPNFHHRPSFDLLCRLFLKPGARMMYTRRVLTDSEPSSSTFKGVLLYSFETVRILYRHFGLWQALRWVFVQNHFQMSRGFFRLLKQAFCRR